MVAGAMDATQIVAIVIALLALGLSAFVSGSEIALFSLTPVQLEELEEDELPGGTKVLRMLENSERLLATILITNNLVNVTIVVLLNFALGPVFESLPPVASFILQTVILTFLILLFGEILPKLYANNNNLAWALKAAPGVSALMKIFYPLSTLLAGSSGFIGKIVTKRRENLTANDLSQALDLTDVTAADAADKQMLEGILRFGDTTAGEIMTPRVDMTDIDSALSFQQVLEIVVSTGYARIPVYEGTEDNIKGVLYARDLLPYIGEDATPPEDWTTLLRDPYFVPESRMIDDLLEDFRSRHIHMAIVVDEFGGTQGIVTLEDVLEEIVGDIDDEYDEVDTTYRQLPDGTYIFEGRTLLTDFFRITGLDEADYQDVEEDCETLAGMLLAIKGDFPKEKESLVYGRCRFLILDIDHHRITSVRVKVASDPQV